MLETAMPYRIGKFIPDHCKSRDLMEAWLKSRYESSKKVFESQGRDLMSLKDERKLTFFVKGVFLRAEPPLVYYMELYKLKVDASSTNLDPRFKSRVAYQGSVWRSPTMISKGSSFAGEIFNKFLLSDTRSVVSDNSQSEGGERFWQERVQSAIQNGHLAFGLECESEGGSLKISSSTPLFSIEEMEPFYTQDQDYRGFYKRIAICK